LALKKIHPLIIKQKQKCANNDLNDVNINYNSAVSQTDMFGSANHDLNDVYINCYNYNSAVSQTDMFGSANHDLNDVNINY
ncbi:unnamed protein product, partial [Brachionus calyciflorus]